ncbi:MAG: acyl-CoA dehydrogenase family protein [Chloroflexi bacterium]|nr:acyl-CoA dehydrogenase family protein [Chloroflexota bacterium]
MDLTYAPEDQAYRGRVRAWFREHHPGRLATFEDRRVWHRALYDAGFVGMGWPREFGGQDARPLEQAIVAEEMALARVPGTVNPLGIGIVGPTLIAHGTEAQKRRYLKKILTAEELWCQLYSEPDAGSDLAGLKTSAVHLDGHFVVNGQKVWTSYGYNADFGVLLARTDPSVPKHQGISYFILNMRSPGIEVRPLKQLTGSSEFCEVFFTNVQVPAENLIGRTGQGWELAQTTLGFERGGNLLARVTRHRANLARLIEVTRTLKRDGRPLADDPLVRQKIGRMLAEIEVLRYDGLRVLSRLEKGQRPGPESSVDKLYYSEMDKAHQELVQETLGPYGQVMEGLPDDLALDTDNMSGQPSTWYYNFLYARAGTIYAGSSEIQKNIIGERVLKLPREPRADRAVRSGAGGSGADTPVSARHAAATSDDPQTGGAMAGVASAPVSSAGKEG